MFVHTALFPVNHSKKDGGMSILPRFFAKNRFYMLKTVIRRTFYGIKISENKVLSTKTYIAKSIAIAVKSTCRHLFSMVNIGVTSDDNKTAGVHDFTT